MMLQQRKHYLGVRQLAFASVAVVLCTTLQGCTTPLVEGYIAILGDIKVHSIGYWRAKPEYWPRFQFNKVDPTTGNLKSDAVGFNSCMDPDVDGLHVCSGRGKCMPFSMQSVTSIWFCQCNEGWGDPNCGTERKKQSTAWILSLLVGFLGLDEFYLGWPMEGMAKIMLFVVALCNFGFGNSKFALFILLTPWMFDIVRIGTAPVRAREYVVAGDLPRWAFATFTLFYFAFIAIGIGVTSMYYAIIRKRQIECKMLSMGFTKS